MHEARAERSVKAVWGIRSPVYWSLLGLVIERPGFYAYQLARHRQLLVGYAREQLVRPPHLLITCFGVQERRAVAHVEQGHEAAHLDFDRRGIRQCSAGELVRLAEQVAHGPLVSLQE